MVLIKIGILCCYVNIAALATTDILRLLKGSTISVFTSYCICDKCGHKIPIVYQIPIVSYIICRGKCKYCGEKIEIKNFLFEILLFVMFTVISLILKFSPFSVLISFIAYEIIKLLLIIFKGRKEHNFFKEYFLSIFSNIFIFMLVFSLAYLNNYIEV